MSSVEYDACDNLEMARVHFDFYGRCPERGVSHDSRPCCICGKTIFNDGTRAQEPPK